MLLGGKCTRCGFNGDIASFEFHHKNSSEKDFAIGNVANKSWRVIKEEVSKCELLCSNCHRSHHSGEKDKAFIEEVRNYNGTNQELIDLWLSGAS